MRIFRIVVLLVTIFALGACDSENEEDPLNGSNDTNPGDIENGENGTDNGMNDPANGEDDTDNGDESNNSIILTFTDHNDEIIEEVEYEENEDIMFPEAPDREGYYFVEWDIPYEEIDFTEDIVVEPIFEINEYTVTVEGPEGILKTLDLEYGESVDLEDPDPMDGFRFIEYQDIPSEVTEDTTVYAIFEEIEEVTLNFYDDSATIIKTVSGFLDDDLEIPEVEEKEGYSFEGWALDSSEEPIDIYTLGEGEHDLYAVYEAEEVTVHFEFNEGSDPKEISIPYFEWVEVETFLDIPTRENYEFSHWEDLESGNVYEEWIIADDLESFTVVAQWDGVTDEWLFDVDDGEATLTKYLKENSDITIPNTIAGKPVTTLGEGLFHNDSFDDLELNSVVIGENVHTIEERAFDSQREIDSLIFENLEGIKHVKSRAFSQVNADNFEFPTELLTIESLAFSNSSISNVTFNNDIKYIGRRAFANAPITGTIEFPNSLKEIGESAFRETPLDSVIFNDGLKVIDDYAFYRNNELNEVSIPSSVETLGNGVFRDTETLEVVTFENGSQVSKIGDYAFEDTPNLHTIMLPENMEIIGRAAFKNNASLETVNLPNSVHTIESEAFRHMSALTYITIPEGVSKLSHSLFWESENLETVNLPESLETIGPQAFRHVKSIETIDIPTGVSEIKGSAFSGTKNLQNIELPDGLNIISTALFYNSGITNITIPEGITEIESNAFNASDIQYVDIPESLQTIHIGAFKSTSNLQPLRLPDSLETISAEAFQSSGLDWVFIPQSVTTLQNNAFTIYNDDLTIYIERSNDHSDWHYNWNGSNNTVVYNAESPE